MIRRTPRSLEERRPRDARRRPSRGPDDRRPPRGLHHVRSAGFTLVELLVTIMLTTLIGAGVVGLLLEQNEFYGANEDRSFADMTRRGAAALVSSELRMLATSDLYKTKGDSIRARFDLGQAVVCDVDMTGSILTLVVYHRPAISLPSGSTGTAYSTPYSADFVYADGWTSTLLADGSSDASLITTCDNNGAPATFPPAAYRVEDWSGHPVGPPPVGSVVRVYGDLVYTFEPSEQGDGLALWRNDQELVAPFAPGAGFAYIMDTGNTETSVPNANHQNIERIRVTAEAIGSGANRHDVNQDLEFDIPFRN